MRARLARQACEPCRRRKVRCNAERPGCSNCRGSSLTCEYSSYRRKRGPKPRTSSATELRNEVNGDPNPSIALEPRNEPAEPLQQAESPSGDSPIFFSPLSSAHFTPLNHVPPPPDASPSQAEYSTPGIALTYEPHNRPQQVHQSLIAALEGMVRPSEDIIRKCIDTCMISLFPLFPIIQPATLRKNARFLLPASQHLFEVNADSNEPPTNSVRQNIVMRDFAHLTAVFACVLCRRRQNSESRQNEALIMAFLAATRGMTACCEDWDISHANSSSLVTRMCQSSALHHLGKTRSSWLMLGQALQLAIDMRLFDEGAYQGLDPLESKLRRNIWAMLCTSDMSASILNNRPLSYHEICLDEIEMAPVDPRSDFRLLVGEGGRFEPPFEARLHEGFFLCEKLWKTATNILLDMNILSRTCEASDFEVSLQNPGHRGIMRVYMTFCGILDSLPAWLRNPESHIAGDDDATEYQRRAFWNQRADIVVTFHCLRLTLLQRAMQKGLCALLGLTDHSDMLALRKIEIASDLASAVTRMPFEALQANGEPLVEKLRRVGVSLLEITHQSVDEPISSRARSLLSTIIDVIARLDSRVSDELNTHPNAV